MDIMNSTTGLQSRSVSPETARRPEREDESDAVEGGESPAQVGFEQALQNQVKEKSEKKGEESLSDMNGSVLPKDIVELRQTLEANMQAKVDRRSNRPFLISEAEKNPKTQSTAASLNTAETITGPNPWNKDWVFHGLEEKDPDLKTLFQPSQAEELKSQMSKTGGDVPAGQAGAVEKLRELIQNLRAQRGEGGGNEAVQEGQLTKDGMRALQAAQSGQTGEVSIAGQQVHKDQLSREMSGSEFLDMIRGVREKSAREKTGTVNEKAARSGNTGVPLASFNSEPRLAPVFERGSSGERNDTLLEAGDFKGRVKNFFDRPNQLSASDDAESRRHSLGKGEASFIGALRSHENRPEPVMPRPVPEVTGHVTTGAMARERLSSESLIGLSSQIGDLGRTGGEIRMRLNPEHLGEVHLKVATQGNHVALQIRASDDTAKRIIEESLPHLRESLASQSLSLGKVDLMVSHSQSAGNGLLGDSQQGQNQHSHGNQAGNPFMREFSGGGLANGNPRPQQQYGGEDSDGRSGHRVGRARGNVTSIDAASAARAARNSGSSRLDVIA